MKILLVARKYLLEIWREPQLMLLTVLMLAAMMLMMAFGYGQNPKLVTYNLLISDTSNGLADEDLLALGAQRYPDERPKFKLIPTTDMEKADASLRNKEAAALVVFDRDASGKLIRSVKGDATNMAFINASGYLEAALNPIQERREGLNPIVDMQSEALSLHIPQTKFDAFAPGVMIMAILLLIPQTATLIGRELRMGTNQAYTDVPFTYNGMVCRLKPGANGDGGRSGGADAWDGQAAGFPYPGPARSGSGH